MAQPLHGGRACVARPTPNCSCVHARRQAEREPPSSLLLQAPRGDDGGWGGESLAMSEEAAGEAQRREAVGALGRSRRSTPAARFAGAVHWRVLFLCRIPHPLQPDLQPDPRPAPLVTPPPPQASEAEPLRRLRISSFLRDQLSAAASVHGADLNAALSGMGEALGQQLQTVLAAAG
jgi:hypothetical protein